MTGRLFVDTNILIYALDPDNPHKRQVSADLLRQTISNRSLTLSPQSLNECYQHLKRVAAGSPQGSRLAQLAMARGYIRTLAPWAIAPLDARTTERAFAVQDATSASWWDSLLLAAALLAECRLFISEDLQDGREVFGMRIANPFAAGFAKAIRPK